jgi:hypothetical protein
MTGIPTPVAYLLIAWGVITAVLIVLVIYGNTLSTREDEELYVNKTEESIMAGGQQALIGRMNRLARVILYLAIVSGVLLLASVALLVWIGLGL